MKYGPKIIHVAVCCELTNWLLSFFQCHTTHIDSCFFWRIRIQCFLPGFPGRRHPNHAQKTQPNPPTSSISSGRTISLVCRINSGGARGLRGEERREGGGVCVCVVDFWLYIWVPRKKGDACFFHFFWCVSKFHPGGFHWLYHMIQVLGVETHPRSS